MVGGDAIQRARWGGAWGGCFSPELLLFGFKRGESPNMPDRKGGDCTAPEAKRENLPFTAKRASVEENWKGGEVTRLIEGHQRKGVSE